MAARQESDDIAVPLPRASNNHNHNDSPPTPTLDGIGSLDLVKILPYPSSELFIAAASPLDTITLKPQNEPQVEQLPRRDEVQPIRGRQRRRGGKFDLAELMEESDEEEKKKKEIEENKRKQKEVKELERQKEQQQQVQQNDTSQENQNNNREVLRFGHPIYQSGLSSKQSLTIQRDFHIYFRIPEEDNTIQRQQQQEQQYSSKPSSGSNTISHVSSFNNLSNSINNPNKKQTQNNTNAFPPLTPVLRKSSSSQQITNTNTLSKRESEQPLVISKQQSQQQLTNLSNNTNRSLQQQQQHPHHIAKNSSFSPNDSSMSPKTLESPGVIIKVPIQDETLEIETVAEATRSAICYVNNMLVLQKAKIRLAENEDLFELYVGKKDGRRKSLPALCPTEHMKKFGKSNLILVPISQNAVIRQPNQGLGLQGIECKQDNYYNNYSERYEECNQDQYGIRYKGSGDRREEKRSEGQEMNNKVFEKQNVENEKNNTSNEQTEENKGEDIADRNEGKEIASEMVSKNNVLDSQQNQYNNNNNTIQKINIKDKEQQQQQIILNQPDPYCYPTINSNNSQIQEISAGAVENAHNHYNVIQDISENNLLINKKGAGSTIATRSQISGKSQTDTQQYDEQLAPDKCCLFFSCFFSSSKKQKR